MPEGLPLAPSTVHRLLSRAGLMAKEAGETTSKESRFHVLGDHHLAPNGLVPGEGAGMLVLRRFEAPR